MPFYRHEQLTGHHGWTTQPKINGKKSGRPLNSRALIDTKINQWRRSGPLRFCYKRGFADQVIQLTIETRLAQPICRHCSIGGFPVFMVGNNIMKRAFGTDAKSKYQCEETGDAFPYNIGGRQVVLVTIAKVTQLERGGKTPAAQPIVL